MIRILTFITAFLLCIGFAYPERQTDSLNYLIETGNPEEILSAIKKLARINFENNSWGEAQFLYEKGLKVLDTVPLPQKTIDSFRLDFLLELAYINLIYSAEYNNSLRFLINAAKIAEQSNDTSMIIETNKLIGVNFRILTKYEKALSYLDISIDYAKLSCDTAALISSLNEKANVLLFLKSYDDSEKYRYEALDLANRTNDRSAIVFVSNDLALLLSEKGEYRKALSYLFTVYKYGKEISSNRYISVSAINIADSYMKLNIVDSALYYYKIAEEISVKHKLKSEYLGALAGLNDLYFKTGQYKKAYQYQKMYYELNDSVFNIEKEKQIAEISTKYESAKKEKENEMLKQQNRIQELQLEKGKSKFLYTVILAGIVGMFISVIVLILYKSNRNKKRINKELEDKNRQITLQKDQLVETLNYLSKREKELEEANITKDKFFSIIAHDIKNPFTSILGFSGLLKDEFDSLGREKQKKYAELIYESSDNLFRLLENLLQWARSQTDRIERKPEKFNISQLLDSNISLYKNAAIKKEIDIVTDYKTDIWVFADKGMADMVIRNLFSNAVKFTKRKGRIEVSVIEKRNYVQVGIFDNGVGLKQSDVDKLFRIDSKVKSSGTENEQGTGLGLIICKEFVEKNGGKIWVESKENAGSKFFFTLPSAQS